MLNENRFLDTFRGHSKRTNKLRLMLRMQTHFNQVIFASF